MPSSVIRRFHYDAAQQTLDVLFVTGRVYRYADVPADLVERFRGAFAKGRFFNARIRDRFAYVELAPEDADLGEF
jgi:hypothetical protein